jgi:hypothetical protein
MVDRLASPVRDHEHLPRNLRAAEPLDVCGREPGPDKVSQGLDGDTVQDEVSFGHPVLAVVGKKAKGAIAWPLLH